MGGIAILLSDVRREDVGMVIQVAMSATFLVAGVAKVHQPSAAAAAMVQFKITRVPHLGLSRLLGAAECLIGFGLLAPMPYDIPATIAASVAGSVFTLAILAALRRGEEFACHCFSTSDRTPISGRTALRSAAICAVGLLLSVDAAWHDRQGSWIRDVEVGIAVVGICVLCIQLRKLQNVRRLASQDLNWSDVREMYYSRQV